MVDSTQIRGPFGSERLPVPNILEGEGQPAPAALHDGPRVPINDEVLSDQPGFREARAARDARAQREDASVLETIGAAMSTWDTTRLIQRLGRPSFDEDRTGFNIHEALQQVPMVLSEDELEYMTSVGKGPQSFQYALDQVKSLRQAQEVVGDSPLVGTLTMFADPLWLAIPPAVRLGKASAVAGRAVSGVAGGAIAGGVTAFKEGPVADEDIALSMVLGSAAGVAFYKGGKLVQKYPDFPKEEAVQAVQDIQAAKVTAQAKPRYKLVSPEVWEEIQIPPKEATFKWEQAGVDSTGKPRMRRVLDQPAEPARTERRKVKEAVWEEVPQELSPAVAPTVDAKTIVQATEKALVQESKARGLGSKLMWNMHKTMEGFGPVGKKVADMLYDNNSDLSKNSLESHREAILSDLRRHQYEYEDLMRQTMAARGFGTWKMVNPFTSREAYAAQRQIELDVQRELFRREQSARLGRPVKDAGVPREIAEMADKIDELHKRALKEMQAAGVEGAENLLERPGYLNRRWSSASMEDIVTRMEGKGIPREKTLTKLTDMVSLSLRRANPRMDGKIAKQIGSAIIDRAMRKGVFEDSVFNAPGSPSVMAEMRDILTSSGLSHADVERALDVLRVSTDEAGKQSFMKHRLDLDYRAQVRIGDETISVMDLIDNRVSSILDQYTKRVATSTAFARMGLVRPSDIENLRTELMKSVPIGKREEAKELFDNTLAHFRGDPAGAKVNDKFRLYQAYGRAISLAWSGLWQVTEYANAAAEYGLRKTLKYAAQEIPGFKGIMSPDKATARSLQNVLADHSVQSLRLRPFIARFEDGYDMNMGSAMQLSSQPMGALVPYANAMRYVHHHQAKLVGNLILDRVDQAARGNKEAAENLRKYGLESHVMDKLSQEVKKHGFNVDAWDDEVWAAARPAFAKMMDASVLKSRLGDIPAFAAFDQVGKLLFTYRTFVLTAHNKVLAGGLERNGAAALGLVLMYQLPLTLAAVNAQSVVRGEGLLSEEDMVKRALGQMGAIGLFSEPLKWVTGESNSVGATYLIPADRGVQLFQSAVNADADRAASTTMSLLPVLSTSPFFRGMADQIKE